MKNLLLNIYSDKINNNKEELVDFLIQKKFINEVKKNDNIEYGCLMLFFHIPKWNYITSLIKKEDIYDLDGYGIENEPHVTILYGFHDDVKPNVLLDEIKNNFNLKPIEIKINEISIFENSDYDVVKFDVDSDDLVEINKFIKKFPHTSDYSDYKPHMTISYVKRGMGKKYIKKLKKTYSLFGNKLVYSDKNKNKDILNLNSLNEEKKSKYSRTKESILKSKTISKEMKERILQYLGGGSTYKTIPSYGGIVLGLNKPEEFLNKTKKSNGVSLGADKRGFFCYTHRASSKRYETPEKIPVKQIEFIESTG